MHPAAPPANRAQTGRRPANAFSPRHNVGAATRFTKGVSGNPSGRGVLGPRVAELIDRCCGTSGIRLIEGLAAIALGNAHDRERFFGESVRVAARDRLWALGYLTDRRFGRPPATVEGDGKDQPLPVTIVNVFAEDGADSP